MHFQIQTYSFGSMKVNNQVYTKDLIIGIDRIIPNWWRKEGHGLHLEDLGEIIKIKPEILVIGTGAYDRMKVPDKLIQTLSENYEIELMHFPSEEAVKKYTEYITNGKKVVGAFHLTC